MSFSYEDRLSDSPFVESIWRTESETQGRYLAVADGSWDFLLVRQHGSVQMFMAGPASKAAPLLYEPGVEYLGIRFRVGTFMPVLPASAFLDDMIMLPSATRRSFWLHDAVFQYPRFDHVEAFIEKMIRHRLLARDEVVSAVLEGEQAKSVRSIQRHFVGTTGLTHHYLQQIERARYAISLLQQGKSIVETAFAAGYTDQPHMTKALKHLSGQTPGEIIRQNRQNQPQ